MSNENNLPVTVYSKPRCVQCDATYRFLKKHKIRYRSIDVSQDQVALDMIAKMGYQQAPVVIVPFDYDVSVHHWSGFDPDNLKQLIVA